MGPDDLRKCGEKRQSRCEKKGEEEGAKREEKGRTSISGALISFLSRSLLLLSLNRTEFQILEIKGPREGSKMFADDGRRASMDDGGTWEDDTNQLE